MIRYEFWAISTLISIGIIGGLIYNWPQIPSGEVAENPIADTEEVKPYSPLEDSPKSELTGKEATDLVVMADRYLTGGNFAMAAQNYELACSQSVNEPALLLRHAFALELSGAWSEADEAYQKCLSIQTLNPNQKIAGTLGRVRTWNVQNRQQEAFKVLCDIYLRHGGDSELHELLRKRLAWQIQRLKQKMLQQNGEAKRLSQFQHGNCLIDPLDYLQLLDAVHQPKQVLEEMEFQIIQKPDLDVHLIAYSGFLRLVPIGRLLTIIEESAGLELLPTDRAQKQLYARSIEIDCEGMTLATLLDSVLIPHNLTWRQEGQQIFVEANTERSNRDNSHFLAQSIIRSARYISVNFGDSEEATYALIVAGNMHQYLREYDEASKYYRQLEQQTLAGEISGIVSFNQALLAVEIGRGSEALDLLYSTVDQSLDLELKSIAYSMIGEISLYNDDLEQAIQINARCISLTRLPQTKSRATLNLARAQLLANNPHAANQAIFAQKEFITDPDQVSLAAVLGAYARVLGTVTNENKRLASERLIVALTEIDFNRIEGLVDRILLSRALNNVGLTEQAVHLLDSALAKHDDVYWKRRLQYELAFLSIDSANLGFAKSLLSQLSADTTDSIGIHSAIRLAKLELVDRNYDQTIDVLTKIWKETQDQGTRKEILGVLGTAFQGKGDAESAAYCFAGMLPGLAVPALEVENAKEFQN